jgi:predicted dithiol-disulfide oxidoreductase (DUF899 family)
MANAHENVSPKQWLEARKELLASEKQLTVLREQVAQKRRALPWTRVDKAYEFASPQGTLKLIDLFQDRSQLLVYHLMFAPDWQAACKSCSFWADSFSPMIPHLRARDVSFAAVSRAPLPKLQAYAQRMGWQFPWVSSQNSTFNQDFRVSFEEAQIGQKVYNFDSSTAEGSEMPGFSVFARDPSGAVYRTYSCYSRGIDMMNPVYQALDLVPKGRDEAGLSFTMAWVKRHDEY